MYRNLFLAAVLALTALVPLVAHAEPSAQALPDGAVLTLDDLGPGFEVINDKTTTFGGATVYYVLYGRDPVRLAQSGPYVVESAFVGGSTAAIDQLMDGLVAGLGTGQVFDTSLVDGPLVGDNARWVAGTGMAEDTAQELHGVLAQVGQVYIAVIVLGFEGQVDQSHAADYASTLVDRLMAEGF